MNIKKDFAKANQLYRQTSTKFGNQFLNL